MKTACLCVMALLIASVAANFCEIRQPTGNGVDVMNLTKATVAPGTAMLLGHRYNYHVSLCKKKSFDSSCTGYAYVTWGNLGACFQMPANVSNFNSTSNSTNIVFKANKTRTSLLRAAVEIKTLEMKLNCKKSLTTDALVPVPATTSLSLAGNLVMAFESRLACPTFTPTPPPSPSPTPVSTTAAPTHIDHGDDDDGLSTWAIVGIIVGVVVFLVVIAFIVVKCRASSDAPADGQYSRV